jgi:hypothetical protein
MIVETVIERKLRAMHRARAEFLYKTLVPHPFDREPRQVEVAVFTLRGHPLASRCYVWENGGHVTIVLGIPPVVTPAEALRRAYGD